MTDHNAKIVETIAVVRKRIERDLRWLAEWSNAHPEISLGELLDEVNRVYQDYVKINASILRAVEETEIQRRKSS
jgi:hypothetical protein